MAAGPCEYTLTDTRVAATVTRVRIGYGHAGWVRVDEVGLPGPLYLRLRPDDRGRWRVTELYLDGRGRPLTGEMLRTLPLAAIETVVQSDGEDQRLARNDEYAGVQLSELASYYSTTFGRQARGWVADAWRSQFPNSGLPRVKRQRDRRDQEYVRAPAEVPPLAAPEGGLTDDFLRDVARAYTAVVEQGDRQLAEVLARQAGVSRRTIHRWVYTARQRGIMPPGHRGRVG